MEDRDDRGLNSAREQISCEGCEKKRTNVSVCRDVRLHSAVYCLLPVFYLVGTFSTLAQDDPGEHVEIQIRC
jgi:hypothetical protein